MIIGILSRVYESEYNLEMASWINHNLGQLCFEAGLGFIDPWHEFMGHSNMYRRDGIHLNYSGSTHLATLITRKISSMKNQEGFGTPEKEIQTKKDTRKV